MMMMMKRQREESSDVDQDITSMANSLIMLSSSGGGGDSSSRVFECKTCNRQFQSFQALGGHRASHKKPRLMADERPSPPPKPKTHECSICGLEFAIGQALGGHMRRHRSAAVGSERKSPQSPPASMFVLSTPTPVVKKSNSRRVLCLDLNLTPSENSFVFGNVAPVVHCFI